MFHGHAPTHWLCSLDIFSLFLVLRGHSFAGTVSHVVHKDVRAGCSFAALHRRSALVTLVLVSWWCSALSVRLRALKDCCVILAVSACVK
jgi:hypothetical protein